MPSVDKSYKTISQVLFLVFLLFLGIFFFWQEPFIYLKSFISDNSLLSIFVFIFLMFISEVIIPITVLPLIPVAAIFFGALPTAIYSIIGWGIGAVVSFLIARHLGKPILHKFVSEKEILKYEKYVPEHIGFWWLVFLRMVVPVDILSYAVGLFSSMSLGKYTLATIIGIIPFSFVFSYGYEIFLGNKIALIISGLFVMVVFSLLCYFHYSYAKENN